MISRSKKRIPFTLTMAPCALSRLIARRRHRTGKEKQRHPKQAFLRKKGCNLNGKQWETMILLTGESCGIIYGKTWNGITRLCTDKPNPYIEWYVKTFLPDPNIIGEVFLPNQCHYHSSAKGALAAGTKVLICFDIPLGFGITFCWDSHLQLHLNTASRQWACCCMSQT